MAVSGLLPLGSERHQLANQPIIYKQYAASEPLGCAVAPFS
jgi:hypothetical protein